MKIFVTGATGFIGQYLVQALLDRHGGSGELSLFCLVRDPSRLPGHLRDRVIVLPGDHTALQNHAATIRGCEYIYHVGARSALGDGAAYREDNIAFTNDLIGIAESASHLKRFVFTSTIGAVDRTPEDTCSLPLDERSTPHPLSDYGKSKLDSEIALERSKLPYTIVRPTWVYGPGMRRESHIRFFLDAVVSGKPFTWFDLPGKVSLIHVNDLVRSMLFVADQPASLRQIYFAADPQPLSLGQLFRLIGGITGVRAGRVRIRWGIPFLFKRMRKYLPLTAQNLFSDVLCASGSKIRDLGFHPMTDLHTGILETAHWHFKQKGRELSRPPGRAVVTGGASGIGKAVANALYARGYALTIVDRDLSRAQEAARPLNAEVLLVDLSLDADIEEFATFLDREADSIDVLVNNAGIGKRGLFAEMDPAIVRTMLMVNCLAPMMSTRAVLPVFLASKRLRTIINIASSAAYQPLPYMAVYAASKACLLSFSDAVSGECGSSQNEYVEIITVSPSGTATNFQASAGVKNDDSGSLLTAEDIAAAIIRAIGKGNRNLIVGSSGKGMALAARFLPRKIQILLWERLMKSLR